MNLFLSVGLLLVVSIALPCDAVTFESIEQWRGHLNRRLDNFDKILAFVSRGAAKKSQQINEAKLAIKGLISLAGDASVFEFLPEADAAHFLKGTEVELTQIKLLKPLSTESECIFKEITVKCIAVGG